MAFNGTEGSPITLALASAWTASFRNDKPTNPSSSSYPDGHFFGKEIIEKILSQEGCKGIRIYYALDENGTAKLILSGADALGNDQIRATDTLAEYSSPCPPHCGIPNPLNA